MLKMHEMTIKVLWIALIALNLVGCASSPSNVRMMYANYGERPNEARAKKTITNYLESSLIDPDSLRLKCAEPQKGWAREASSRPPRFGWIIYCEVNAKNRLGGYTGAKPDIYLFNGNNLVGSYGNASKGYQYDFLE